MLLFFCLVMFFAFCYQGLFACGKSISFTGTKILTHPLNGSNYGTACAINEYGMVIYRLEGIKDEEAVVIAEAAEIWNDSFKRKVFVDYREIGASEEDIDLVIVPSQKGSYCDLKYAGLGYGLSVGELGINADLLNEQHLKIGTIEHAWSLSTIRHEIGHCLGLAHDRGMMMSDLGTAQIAGDEKMLTVATKMKHLLDHGILPKIPRDNVAAVLYVLDNLSELYHHPDTNAYQITRQTFGLIHQNICGIKYVNFQVKVLGNTWVWDLDAAPNTCIGNAIENDLLNRKVHVQRIYLLSNNNLYYAFDFEGKHLVMTAETFLEGNDYDY